MDKKYISPKELAESLGLAEQTVYHWVSQRKLPFYKLGKSVRFAMPEIQEWLQKRRVSSVIDFTNRN